MNDATKLIANEAKSIVQAHLDRLGEPKEHQISAQAKQEKFAQIQAELEKQNAVLVAHYYCDPEVQELAELTGGCVSDSLKWHVLGVTILRRPWWWLGLSSWVKLQKYFHQKNRPDANS